jgi:hypothetical protein
VSDSGTGNHGNTRKLFSVPALMDPLQPRPPRPCPCGQTATFNRRPISTETSLPSLTTAGAGILNLLSIVYALRPRLRSRLTLGGRTFPRKPWVYGGQEFDLSYRYSCLHPHFLKLDARLPLRFNALRTLPYQSNGTNSIEVQSFGMPFIANHYRREIAR